MAFDRVFYFRVVASVISKIVFFWTTPASFTKLKSMKIVFGAILYFVSLFVLAEPMPWGLMIKGNECSKYWAGDECVYYELPTGWKEVYPSGKYLNFNGKKCSFQIGKEEACCKELGLNFKDIKLEKTSTKDIPAFCKPI